jgi:hypothetical protein
MSQILTQYLTLVEFFFQSCIFYTIVQTCIVHKGLVYAIT